MMAQYWTHSVDAGASFEPQVRVSDVTFPPAVSNPNPSFPAAWCYAGDYNALTIAGEDAWLAWGDTRDSMLADALPHSVPDPNVYARRMPLTSRHTAAAG